MTALRSFDESLPMALLRAREVTMRRFRPILSAHDLTEQQWRVVRALAGTDGSLDAGEIAEATFLLGPSLSRILANLEDRRLILRRTDPADHRRSEVRLSAAGRRLFEQIAPLSEATYVDIEETFGPGRLRQLLGLLKRLEEL